MFDHVWAPLLPSFRARILRGGGRPIGIAIAVAVAASAGLLATTAGSAYAADPITGITPSIQYEEALAHSDKTYTFAAGGPVTVPYQPRFGDSEVVDGAAAVPLPASRASGVKAPSLARPGAVAPNATLTALRREVLGFLPYWELGSTLNYDTLSTVAYFGVNLNGDGTLAKSGSGWNGWVSSTMTTAINDAHAHGTRVALTVESFAWDSGGVATQSAVLSNPAVSLSAAQQIAAEVANRGVDGVNLDFEPIASGQVTHFVEFTRMLRAELDKVHPGYELTFCATGAPGTYDLPNLLAPGAADAVFIMGYDFRGGTPTYTGSIDPLTSSLTTYSLTKVVNNYLSQVPASKVILGLPWYGHAWSTGPTNAVYARTADLTTYGQPASGITYASALDIAAAHLSDPTPGNGLQYDTAEETAWTAYFGRFGGTQDTWRELYFDNPRSLSARIDAIDGWGLRGMGIWALGYDNNNGNGDMTNTVAGKLETSTAPTTYHALTPTRILDSRYGTGLSNVFSSHVARTLQVTGVGGVPVGATAVTGNLTVTAQTSAGYLYLGPVAAADPTSSTLNFPKGDDRANGVTVALNGLGTVSATYVGTTSPATTHVIFDVTGYFTPDTSGATYVQLTPNRVLDTRNGTGSSGPLGPHGARTFTVANGTSGVPGNAIAVTGNLTVTAQNSPGYLYIGPNATNDPTSSTLNFPVADDRANSVTVALGSGGTLSVTFIGSGSGAGTHVVFDVTGYFTPDGSGATFVPLTPSRILDTRGGPGLSGPFSSHASRTFGVTGQGGVPTGAAAVTGNLTVTAQTSAGFLYLGPNATNNPTSSTLNFPKSDDRANGATVAIGLGGTLSITYVPSASAATCHVIFDVTGYFAR
jgi:spore germination protein YaaH